MKWKQKQLVLGTAVLSERCVCPASPTGFPELSGQMEKCHVSLVRSHCRENAACQQQHVQVSPSAEPRGLWGGEKS